MWLIIPEVDKYAFRLKNEAQPSRPEDIPVANNFIAHLEHAESMKTKLGYCKALIK